MYVYMGNMDKSISNYLLGIFNLSSFFGKGTELLNPKFSRE